MNNSQLYTNNYYTDKEEIDKEIKKLNNYFDDPDCRFYAFELRSPNKVVDMEKIKELIEGALNASLFDRQFKLILELAELLEMDVSEFKD